MEPLKNLYNQVFLEFLGNAIADAVPAFDKAAFHGQIFDSEWEQKELKQRMRHIAATLKHHLRGDFADNVEALHRIIDSLRKAGAKVNAFEYMFLPDFVELYGQEDVHTSLVALEQITQFTSCEFAVRPFIASHQEVAMQHMQKWSTHKSQLVRRLASEGCRPRLPWAMALPNLKKDPGPIIPILENLKNDSSEFVRRSVANNLNDIAKDNPDVVLELAKRWKGRSPLTDWIIKHGCRTLLRKANDDALGLFGLPDASRCRITDLALASQTIAIGEALEFSFELANEGKNPIRLRVEFGIDYVKANGKTSRKLFKITENDYEAGKKYSFKRAHSFRNLTTRTHYPGVHQLAIVLNGQEKTKVSFEVTK